MWRSRIIMRRSIARTGLCVLFPSLIAAVFVAWWRWYWRRVVVDASLGTRPAGALRQKGRVSNRQTNNSKVEFTIPDAVVGYVIGRRGNRIRQIEAETGAQVHFKERIGTEDTKVVSITGPAEGVESAESVIRSVVQDRLSQNSEQKESRILIGECDVGRLIGRRGANIRSIKRQSGANISVEEGGESGGNRLCLVTGSSRQIEEALLLIEETIHIRPGHGRGEGEHMERQNEKERRLALIPAHLPQTRDYFAVFVSAIDGEGGIWVQPIEQQEPALLEDLVQDMTSLYSGLACGEAAMESIEIDSVCAAPFEHDSSWYRAIVTALPTTDTASLLYVDYGDSGMLPRGKLKMLRPEFWTLQCQAVRCVLDSVTSIDDDWSEEALSALEELTHSASWKAVMLRVVVPAQHSVTIVDTNTDQDVNIAEQMVNRGFAKWAKHTADPVQHISLHQSNYYGRELEALSSVCLGSVVTYTGPSNHEPSKTRYRQLASINEFTRTLNQEITC